MGFRGGNLTYQLHCPPQPLPQVISIYTKDVYAGGALTGRDGGLDIPSLPTHSFKTGRNATCLGRRAVGDCSSTEAGALGLAMTRRKDGRTRRSAPTLISPLPG